MWRHGLSTLLVVVGLGASLPAQAQPPNASLVLVVESSEGVSGANQLRASLSRQFGIKVVALGEVDLDAEPPGAMMAIATERTNAVRVVYVDARGRRDTLRAPAPPRREDIPSVVQALAGALLQRHIKDLTQSPGRADQEIEERERRMGGIDDDSRMSWSAFSRSLHAALSRIGYPRHRSGDLHREDF
jgi:hypothetical protein